MRCVGHEIAQLAPGRSAEAKESEMIDELDLVVLTEDLPKVGLVRGDSGTVVLVMGEGDAFLVEFIDPTGWTIALESLMSHQIRPLRKSDRWHVREIDAVSA